LEEFNKTNELGLQVVLNEVEAVNMASSDQAHTGVGAIIVGSDQGLCGSFNQQISLYGTEQLSKLAADKESKSVIAVGDKVIQYLGKFGIEIEESLHFPVSTTAINQLILTILTKAEEWSVNQKIQKILIFYNKPGPDDSFAPFTQQLLPLNMAWIGSLTGKKWPGPTLPMFTMDRNLLLAALLRQHLFFSLYTALVESLVSENRSRLLAMQAADRNIDNKLEQFRTEYHNARQAGITAELLDIVTGYEAITQPRKHSS
jgi:F-type H+-transporting ATPase subunit gamma